MNKEISRISFIELKQEYGILCAETMGMLTALKSYMDNPQLIKIIDKSIKHLREREIDICLYTNEKQKNGDVKQ